MEIHHLGSSTISLLGLLAGLSVLWPTDPLLSDLSTFQEFLPCSTGELVRYLKRHSVAETPLALWQDGSELQSKNILMGPRANQFFSLSLSFSFCKMGILPLSCCEAKERCTENIQHHSWDTRGSGRHFCLKTETTSLHSHPQGSLPSLRWQNVYLSTTREEGDRGRDG